MASLLSYALTTVADVKESMGVASSDQSWDNIITRKINQATRQIEAYCDRRFKETVYTNEEYDSPNTRQLTLKQRPVTDTTTFNLQIRDTDLNDSDWEDLDTSFYFVDTNAGVVDSVVDLDGSWNRYRVTYSAGYATIPEDLAEACAELAAYYAVNAGANTIGIKEKQEGSRRVQYKESSTPGDFESVIGQLGIDTVIESYANYPVLADK